VPHLTERYATRITYFPRRGQIPRRGRTSKIPKMVFTLFSLLEVFTGYCKKLLSEVLK
jgi:hypothetical protein